MLLCRLYFVKPHGLLVLLHRKCHRYCHVTLHHLKLFCHQCFELLLYVCILILRRNGTPIFRPDLSNLLCVLMLFWINKCFFLKIKSSSYTDWTFLTTYYVCTGSPFTYKPTIGYLNIVFIVSKYAYYYYYFKLCKD